MFPFSLYVGPEKMLGKKKRSEEEKKWKKKFNYYSSKYFLYII